MFAITVSTTKDEKLDIQSTSLNKNKPLRFYYSSDIEFTGAEKWVWDFDYQAAKRDINIVTSIGLLEPIDISFPRAGERKVNVSVFSGTTLLVSDIITINIYEFPTAIVAPEYVTYNETVAYGLNNEYEATSYTWYVNGAKQNSQSSTINVTFSETLIKANVVCIISNDGEQATLKASTAVWISNSVGKARYDTNVTENLMFFNKEGDYLNFNLTSGTNTASKFWDGDLIFHANSSDTYKTIGLYVLEKVNPINISNSNLQLQRNQLFNELGIDFIGGNGTKTYISKIEIATTGVDFYSKWLYSTGIQNIYSLGDEIVLADFNSLVKDTNSNPISFKPIDEFSSTSTGFLNLFTVVASKPNAILVLTKTNNSDAKADIEAYTYGSYTNYLNKVITVPQGYVYKQNLIKLHDVSKVNQEWNEPEFVASMYNNKRLSIVNSLSNDGLYTVSETNDLQPASKFVKKTIYNSLDLVPDNTYGFKIEAVSKSSKIVISNDTVDFLPASDNSYLNDRSLVLWRGINNKEATPAILKKGVGFAFDTNSEGNNMQISYKALGTGFATDILTPQSTTETGLKISFKDYDSLAYGNSVVLTLDKTTYTLTIANPTVAGSGTWVKASQASTAYTSLSYAINRLDGISSFPLEDGILLYGKNSRILQVNTTASTISLNVVSNYLSSSQPEYGIVDGEWQILDTTDFSGYIHYNSSLNTYNILYISEQNSDFVKNWYILKGDKKVTWVETAQNIEFEKDAITTTYLLDNKLSFEIAADKTSSSSMMIQKFSTNFKESLKSYGIDCYVVSDELVLSRMYTTNSLLDKDDYIGINAYIKGADNKYVSISSIDESAEVSYIAVEETLKNEASSGSKLKASQIWNRKIIVKNIDSSTGFLVKINGLELPVAYDNIATPFPALEDKILDVEETLLDWGNQHYADTGKTYHETLEDLGILVWLEKSRESYVQGVNKFDTIVLETKFPNIPVQYEILNTLDTHKILHSDVTFNNILGSSFRVTINTLPYSITNTGNISTTLTNWITEYADTLFDYGIVVECFDKTLRFSTLAEKTKLVYQIWAGTNNADFNELYYITPWRTGREGTIIAGNELFTSKGDFQEMGFATGMITHIGNCEITANNKEYNILSVDPQRLGLSYQGAFWGSNDKLGFGLLRSGFDWTIYDERPLDKTPYTLNISVKTREFLRYPREGYDSVNPTILEASWQDTTNNDMFFFDFSGEQLRYLPSDAAAYIGITPLLDDNHNGYLNRTYNKDKSKTLIASCQQTVFDNLTFPLEHIDDENDVSPIPKPLQIFVGFNSKNEGVSSNTLNLYRNPNISVNIKTSKQDSAWKDVLSFDPDTNVMTVVNPTTINFIDAGVKIGQIVRISGTDYLNNSKQASFKNSGLDAEILDVGVSSLTLNPLNKLIVSEISYGQTTSILPPFRKKDSAFNVTIEVLPSLLANIRIKGQTEIEDERYKVLLNNMGHSVNQKDNYIFKEYDINEKGVDWTFVNAKRKEMLMVYPEIYNYISAYKSIINSINYFGYNDLELNEYYQNIDTTSKNYGRLTKIEIPDIFDNTVEGWTEKDYLKKSLPNNQYAKTKLFNLTYKITDFDGNIVLGYSLDEVLVKLIGLKKWLKDEVLMIGTNIKDLTGKASTTSGYVLTQDSRMSQRMIIREYLEPIDFHIESYLQPIVNNSKTYTVSVRFVEPTTEDKPDSYHLKITSYKKTKNGLRSVQTINEYRTNYKPYNLAINEKAEQYLVVETYCDNGYGATYKKMRSYNLINKSYIPNK